jgi:hypothetical protein
MLEIVDAIILIAKGLCLGIGLYLGYRIITTIDNFLCEWIAKLVKKITTDRHLRLR